MLIKDLSWARTEVNGVDFIKMKTDFKNLIDTTKHEFGVAFEAVYNKFINVPELKKDVLGFEDNYYNSFV